MFCWVDGLFFVGSVAVFRGMFGVFVFVVDGVVAVAAVVVEVLVVGVGVAWCFLFAVWRRLSFVVRVVVRCLGRVVVTTGGFGCSVLRFRVFGICCGGRVRGFVWLVTFCAGFACHPGFRCVPPCCSYAQSRGAGLWVARAV